MNFCIFYSIFHLPSYIFHQPSKVLPHSKIELVDENLLEGIQIVLLVKDEHCLLVVDGVNRTETQRTVAVGYQNGITGNTSRTLVAV